MKKSKLVKQISNEIKNFDLESFIENKTKGIKGFQLLITVQGRLLRK